MEQIKYDVFISYSRKDIKVADRIVKAFNDVGITCFIDRQGIGGGMEFPAVLAKAIRESKVFLFLASKNSYNSKFTQSEIVYAFNKKQKQDIIPYIIDGSSLPEELEFTFSAINWRRIEHHPVETVLVDDVLIKTGKSMREKTSLKEKKDSMQENKSTCIPSCEPVKGVGFTGKTLAISILGISTFYFLCMIVSSPIFIKNNYSLIEGVSSFSIILLLIIFIIGLIRPASICLKSRMDVLKYYLSSLLIVFIGFCVIVDMEDVSTETKPSIENSHS